jgi:hydroxyacylglutathione hydrolase
VKKILKRIVIGFLALVVVFVLFAGWLAYRMNAEQKVLRPIPTAMVTAGVYAVQDGTVNLFLVNDGDDCVVIDAGNDIKSVEKGMRSLNFDPAKVKAVFLTHTDGDHVAALRLFRNAKVYISVLEEQMLNGKTHRFFIFNNKIDTPYEKIDDSQTVTIGKIAVKGIMTPGHTPGSICYLVNGQYLFTGDTLSLRNNEVQRFNDFFNMDSKTEEKSIRNLAHVTGVRLILTAHYGVSSDFEKAFHSWR